jgi:hypothetical protein
MTEDGNVVRGILFALPFGLLSWALIFKIAAAIYYAR